MCAAPQLEVLSNQLFGGYTVVVSSSLELGFCRWLRRWWGFPYQSIWKTVELIVFFHNSLGTKLRGMKQPMYDTPRTEQELSDAEIARKLQEEELVVSREDALVNAKQLR